MWEAFLVPLPFHRFLYQQQSALICHSKRFICVLVSFSVLLSTRFRLFRLICRNSQLHESHAIREKAKEKKKQTTIDFYLKVFIFFLFVYFFFVFSTNIFTFFFIILLFGVEAQCGPHLQNWFETAYNSSFSCSTWMHLFLRSFPHFYLSFACHYVLAVFLRTYIFLSLCLYVSKKQKKDAWFIYIRNDCTRCTLTCYTTNDHFKATKKNRIKSFRILGPEHSYNT